MALGLGVLSALPAPLVAAGSLEEAEALLGARRWEEAVEAYRSLSPEVGGELAARLGLARALHGRGAFVEAADAARQAAATATEAADEALALDQLGRSLLARKKKKDYPEATEAFQRAAEVDPGLAVARLHLAEALLLQKQESAACPLLEDLVAEDPGGAVAARASALLRNPGNVDHPSLPAFRLVTLDGRQIERGDLVGQVVLLDFWATWCQPCIQSLPALAQFHEFAAGKPLRLISVSVDEDANALRRFVAERGMGWAVVHDGRGDLRGYFGVNAFPTYLLVDPDGFIVGSARGYSPGLDDPVDRLVRQAKSMVKELERRTCE